MQPHLGVARNGVVGDVRRVRHDDVDKTVELGERRREIGEDELQVGRCKVLNIALGPHERIGRVLDGNDPGVRHLARESQRDRAASGAEIDGEGLGCGNGTERVDRELGDELGFGPRDEDTRARRTAPIRERAPAP